MCFRLLRGSCLIRRALQILLILIWFVPESHLYHARRDDHEKAKSSMLRLYGNAPGYDVVRDIRRIWNRNITDGMQEHEYRVIQHGIQAEREFSQSAKTSSFMEIFNRHNWRRTLAGCMGICSQWTAGAPIVFAYSTVRFFRTSRDDQVS